LEIWYFLVQMMKVVLDFFYSVSHSYGVAIILLTFMVKVLLYPLTQKQFKSMQEMQKLQPLMKKLQEKHKKKPQELQKRMMALYREHKVNPLGGCLPLLVQMPALILLYRTIISIKTEFIDHTLLWTQNAVGGGATLFTDTSFLWMPSLLAPDMPLLIMYAISMYVSQKLTMMPTADPKQEETQKMMTIMMPLLFTFMFKSFPAAFILYWLVYNILTTAQQYPMMLKPAKAAEADTAKSDAKGGRKK